MRKAYIRHRSLKEPFPYSTRRAPAFLVQVVQELRGVAKFLGEVFLDLYDLSERATRYEWLLKEEAKSKGRLLSSQDTDYRDPLLIS